MLECLNSFLDRWLDTYKDGGDASGLIGKFMNDCFGQGFKGFNGYADASPIPINPIQNYLFKNIEF